VLKVLGWQLHLKQGKVSFVMAASNTEGLPPLILLHGIKGSQILSRSKKVLFLNLKQGLGLQVPELSLPVQWEDTEDGPRQGTDGTHPGKMLENVAGIFSALLSSTKAYASILDWAREKYGREVVVNGFLGDDYSNSDADMMEKMALGSTSKRFFVFTYDWRRDNNETAERFLNVVKKLNGVLGEKIQVIGHSNGGLVAWSAINSNPEYFHSALFAATPFGPSLSFLKDMSVKVGFKSLTPEVLFTHPSYYCYYPVYDIKTSDGESAYEIKKKVVFIADEHGNEVDMDYANANAWKDMGLLFPNLEKVESEDMSHLQTCLGQAIKFRKTLEVKDPDSLPPLAVLASNSRATRVGCVVKEIDGSKIYDFSKGSTVMGDGRVPFENATPPRDCNYKVYTTDKEHSAILDDVEKVEQIINELTL